MIGNRIKKFRLGKKMSLSKLAQQAGVAKSYLSSLERNLQQNPSIQLLEKISSVLNVPVEHLIHEQISIDNLDIEWINLIKEAKNSGLSIEKIREFLEFNKWNINKKNQ